MVQVELSVTAKSPDTPHAVCSDSQPKIVFFERHTYYIVLISSANQVFNGSNCLSLVYTVPANKTVMYITKLYKKKVFNYIYSFDSGTFFFQITDPTLYKTIWLRIIRWLQLVT